MKIAAKQSDEGIARSMIVQQSIKDISILTFIADACQNNIKEKVICNSMVSFYTVCMIEVCSTIPNFNEKFMSTILPYILYGCKYQTEHKDTQFQLSTFMIISQLSSRTLFSKLLIDTLLITIISNTKQFSNETLLTFIHLTQSQNILKFPQSFIEYLMSSQSTLILLLNDLVDKYNSSKFIKLYLVGLIDFIKSNHSSTKSTSTKSKTNPNAPAYEKLNEFVIKFRNISESIDELMNLLLDEYLSESKDEKLIESVVHTIENKFPLQFDVILTNKIKQLKEEGKKEKVIQKIININVNQSRHKIMQETGTTLYLSLQHPDKNIRIESLNQLFLQFNDQYKKYIKLRQSLSASLPISSSSSDKKEEKENKNEDEEKLNEYETFFIFYKESLELRLNDEDENVIHYILENAPRLNEYISQKDLFSRLLQLLGFDKNQANDSRASSATRMENDRKLKKEVEVEIVKYLMNKEKFNGELREKLVNRLFTFLLWSDSERSMEVEKLVIDYLSNLPVSNKLQYLFKNLQEALSKKSKENEINLSIISKLISNFVTEVNGKGSKKSKKQENSDDEEEGSQTVPENIKERINQLTEMVKEENNRIILIVLSHSLKQIKNEATKKLIAGELTKFYENQSNDQSEKGKAFKLKDYKNLKDLLSKKEGVVKGINQQGNETVKNKVLSHAFYQLIKNTKEYMIDFTQTIKTNTIYYSISSEYYKSQNKLNEKYEFNVKFDFYSKIFSILLSTSKTNEIARYLSVFLQHFPGYSIFQFLYLFYNFLPSPLSNLHLIRSLNLSNICLQLIKGYDHKLLQFILPLFLAHSVHHELEIRTAALSSIYTIHTHILSTPSTTTASSNNKKSLGEKLATEFFNIKSKSKKNHKIELVSEKQFEELIKYLNENLKSVAMDSQLLLSKLAQFIQQFNKSSADKKDKKAKLNGKEEGSGDGGNQFINYFLSFINAIDYLPYHQEKLFILLSEYQYPIKLEKLMNLYDSYVSASPYIQLPSSVNTHNYQKNINRLSEYEQLNFFKLYQQLLQLFSVKYPDASSTTKGNELMNNKKVMNTFSQLLISEIYFTLPDAVHHSLKVSLSSPESQLTPNLFIHQTSSLSILPLLPVGSSISPTSNGETEKWKINVLTLKKLNDEYYRGLNEENKKEVFNILMKLLKYTRNNKPLEEQIKYKIKQINIPVGILASKLHLINKNKEKKQQQKKKAKINKEEEEGRKKEKRNNKIDKIELITLYIELLNQKANIKQIYKLLPNLFNLLEVLIDPIKLSQIKEKENKQEDKEGEEQEAEEEGGNEIVTKNEYLIQLILMFIRNITNQFKKQDNKKKVKEDTEMKEGEEDDNREKEEEQEGEVTEEKKKEIEKMYRGDVIINCIRISKSPQTHNKCLLLLSSIGMIFPDRIMEHITAIFTFMGVNTLRRDDNYTFHVLSKTIQSIIPNIIARKDNHIIKIINILISSFKYIPNYRRMMVFVIFINSIGFNYFYLVVFMLFVQYSRTNGSKSLENGGRSSNALGGENILHFASILVTQFTPDRVLSSLHQLINTLIHLIQLKNKNLELVDDGEKATDKKSKELLKQILDNYKKESEGNLQLEGEDAEEDKGVNELEQGIVISEFIIKYLQSNTFYKQLIEEMNKNKGKSEEIQERFKEIFRVIMIYLRILSKLRDKVNKKRQEKEREQMNELIENIYQIIELLNEFINLEGFIKIIISLISHKDQQIRRRSLLLLNDKIEGYNNKFEEAEVDLFVKLIKKIVDLLKMKPSEKKTKDKKNKMEIEGEEKKKREKEEKELKVNKQTALYSLEILGRNFGSIVPEIFIDHFEEIMKALDENDLQVKASTFICIATYCINIGKELLKYLPIFFPKMINIIKSTLKKLGSLPSKEESESEENGDEEESGGEILLIISGLSSLEIIIKSMKQFISPYIVQLLITILQTNIVNTNNVQISGKIDGIFQLLAKKMKTKSIIAGIMEVYQTMMKSEDHSHLSFIKLFNLLTESIKQITNAKISPHFKKINEFLFRTFDIRVDLSGRFNYKELIEIESSMINTLNVFVLKLNEYLFKPLFLKLREWSTLPGIKQPLKANRKSLFVKIVFHLSETLKGIMVPLFAYVIDDFVQLLSNPVSYLLGDDESGKSVSSELKSNKQPFTGYLICSDSVQYTVKSLGSCFQYNDSKFVTKERFDSLLSPLTNILDHSLPDFIDYPRVLGDLVFTLGQLAVTTHNQVCFFFHSSFSFSSPSAPSLLLSLFLPYSFSY